MATKAVKILDNNFHISLKLNDLPISVAVGLNAWCELAKSLKSKGGFTDSQTKSRLVQRITPLFSMTAFQSLGSDSSKLASAFSRVLLSLA